MNMLKISFWKAGVLAAGLIGATAMPLAAQADSFSVTIGDGPGYHRPYYGLRYYAPPPPRVYYDRYYYGGPRYYHGPRYYGGYGGGYREGWHDGRRWEDRHDRGDHHRHW